jgi:hypothetical protein
MVPSFCYQLVEWKIDQTIPMDYPSCDLDSCDFHLVRVQCKIQIDKWNGYGLMDVLTTIDFGQLAYQLVRYSKKHYHSYVCP